MNPKTKYIIKEYLSDYLYKKAKNNIAEQIEQIAKDNAALHNMPSASFFYNGFVFPEETSGIFSHRAQLVLDKGLVPRMKEVMKEKKVIEEEQCYTNNFIMVVLNASDTIADYFALMPESLHTVLTKITSKFAVEQSSALTQEKIQNILQEHSYSVDLIKKRMLLNLIS